MTNIKNDLLLTAFVNMRNRIGMPSNKDVLKSVVKTKTRHVYPDERIKSFAQWIKLNQVKTVRA